MSNSHPDESGKQFSQFECWLEFMTKSVFCELAQAGLIRFSGAEAQAFLHNQLSCDVAALTGNKSTYGSYCNPKGRVLATFLLWRSGEDFFMKLDRKSVV